MSDPEYLERLRQEALAALRASMAAADVAEDALIAAGDDGGSVEAFSRSGSFAVLRAAVSEANDAVAAYVEALS